MRIEFYVLRFHISRDVLYLEYLCHQLQNRLLDIAVRTLSLPFIIPQDQLNRLFLGRASFVIQSLHVFLRVWVHVGKLLEKAGDKALGGIE